MPTTNYATIYHEELRAAKAQMTPKHVGRVAGEGRHFSREQIAAAKAIARERAQARCPR